MILNLLKEYSKTPSFLILNKIDKLKSKRSVLELIKTLTCNNIALEANKKSSDQETAEKTDEGGWPHFKSVFMVSSTSGDGVEKIVDFLESQATLQSWEYKNNETTDQTPAQIIEQSVRARLLDYLPQVHFHHLLKTKIINFCCFRKFRICSSRSLNISVMKTTKFLQV